MVSGENELDVPGNGSRGIQSVEIAGRVMEALCAGPKMVTLKQLSGAARMAPSKVHRYMASLIRIGIARQDHEGLCCLGPMALRLGLAAIGEMDIVNAAGRAAEQLARDLGLSVHLSIWGDWGPVVIRLHQGAASPVISTVRLGSVLPLSRSATGLTYLAYEDTIVTAPVLAREAAAASSSVDRQKLAENVATTRARGFASADGTLIPGLEAICAPVFDFQTKLACAITVTAGTGSSLIDPQGRYVRRLCRACAEVSAPFEGAAPFADQASTT